LALEYFLQGGCLVLTAYEKHDGSRIVEYGKRQRNAVGLEFFYPVGDDPARLFLKRWNSRKQRSCVAVGSHAKQDQVEARKAIAGSLEELPKSLLICLCSHFRVGVFSGNAKYVLRRYGNFREQRLANHPIIALCTIRRHVAFVAEEKVDLIPWHRFILRE